MEMMKFEDHLSSQSPTKRQRSCSISGCTRRALPSRDGVSLHKCEWHQLWNWNCSSDTLAALFDSQCISVDSMNIASSDQKSLTVSVSAIKKQLDSSRNRLEEKRKLLETAKMKALGKNVEFDEITDEIVARKMSAGLNFVLKQTGKALVGMSGKLNKNKIRLLDLATPRALKELIETMSATGLLNGKSPLKSLEEPHLLLLIRYYRETCMDGRKHATEKDVENFFHFLIKRRDPLCRDLLLHDTSHFKPFVDAALKM
eukprot:g2596.t1